MRIQPISSLTLNDTNTNNSINGARGKSFSQFLAESLEEVNKLQIDSQKASQNLAAGKVNDVSEVVIAAEKATIALQLTMQVRNKIVDAYQEIMRMQV